MTVFFVCPPYNTLSSVIANWDTSDDFSRNLSFAFAFFEYHSDKGWKPEWFTTCVFVENVFEKFNFYPGVREKCIYR